MNDREIDALVATHLFSWEWFSYPDRTQKYFRPVDSFDYGAIYEPGYELKYTDNLPRYSTDIGAAWQVVEKLNSLDLSNGDKNYQILAKFMNLAQIGDDRNNLLSLSSTEAAKRICLAALQALGVWKQ